MTISGSDGALNLSILICGGTLLASIFSRSRGSPRTYVSVYFRLAERPLSSWKNSGSTRRRRRVGRKSPTTNRFAWKSAKACRTTRWGIGPDIRRVSIVQGKNNLSKAIINDNKPLAVALLGAEPANAHSRTCQPPHRGRSARACTRRALLDVWLVVGECMVGSGNLNLRALGTIATFCAEFSHESMFRAR